MPTTALTKNPLRARNSYLPPSKRPCSKGSTKSPEGSFVGISERGKEIKRRRHRRKKLAQLAGRLQKATVSEKLAIAAKVRSLTPGAEFLIDRWELRETDR
jgi:Family of unknown function (DUF6800)